MIAQLDGTFVRISPGRVLPRLTSYALFEGRPLTTKGRALNRIVFRHLQWAVDRPSQQIVEPVFIIGMGRSGTTLLGTILATHPEVGFLNEPKAMWHLIRDDEDIIGSYSDMPGRLYLEADDADDETVRKARALFSWYLQVSRSRRVVDKYPELVFRPNFVRAIFPDARFLIIVRSPTSVLKSVATWSTKNAKAGADWWGLNDRKWEILWREGVVERADNSDLAMLDLASETDDKTRAAIEWTVTTREAIKLVDSDASTMVLKYEDLIADPEEALERTLAFCRLPSSARVDAYAAATVSSQQQSPIESTPALPGDLGHIVERVWTKLADIDDAVLPTGTAQ